MLPSWKSSTPSYAIDSSNADKVEDLANANEWFQLDDATKTLSLSYDHHHHIHIIIS